jgi:hypothetical protein
VPTSRAAVEQAVAKTIAHLRVEGLLRVTVIVKLFYHSSKK